MLRPDLLASENWIETSKSFEAELRGGGENPPARPAGRADVTAQGMQDGRHACPFYGGGDG